LIVLLSVDIGKANSVNFQSDIDILFLFHHAAETEIKTSTLSVFSPISQTNKPAPRRTIPLEKVTQYIWHSSIQKVVLTGKLQRPLT
jgi:hypothetical protein